MIEEHDDSDAREARARARKLQRITADLGVYVPPSYPAPLPAPDPTPCPYCREAVKGGAPWDRLADSGAIQHHARIATIQDLGPCRELWSYEAACGAQWVCAMDASD